MKCLGRVLSIDRPGKLPPMRVFRVRYTVMQLVVVVMASGVMTWSVQMKRLSHSYRQLAYRHAYMEATDGGRYCSLYVELDDAACPFKWPAGFDGVFSQDAEADARQQFHHRMYHKWLRAASRPWLPVAPDPPEPD
jgi:hypothetical protein